MSDELFRNPERREQERREQEYMVRQNRLNLKALLMTLAIVIAPFLALIISLEFALGVLAVALAFTSWLTWKVAGEISYATGSRLRVAAVMNFGVMLLVLLLLYVRLAS